MIYQKVESMQYGLWEGFSEMQRRDWLKSRIVKFVDEMSFEDLTTIIHVQESQDPFPNYTRYHQKNFFLYYNPELRYHTPDVTRAGELQPPIVLELNPYDIWMEGWKWLGRSKGQAIQLNEEPIMADSFEAAVQIFIQDYPHIGDHIKKRLSTGGEWYYSSSGCKLYPTEELARKKYG